jgi:hypothetical protein
MRPQRSDFDVTEFTLQRLFLNVNQGCGRFYPTDDLKLDHFDGARSTGQVILERQ